MLNLLLTPPNDQAHLPGGTQEAHTSRNQNVPPGQVQRLVRHASGHNLKLTQLRDPNAMTAYSHSVKADLLPAQPNDPAHLPGGTQEADSTKNQNVPPGQVQRLVRHASGHTQNLQQSETQTCDNALSLKHKDYAHLLLAPPNDPAHLPAG